jgi:hypothetical protein
MAAALLFKKRRLMLVLPRQFGGKTELGVQLGEDWMCRPKARSGIFLAKDKKSGKRATREKFMRVFDRKIYEVNTEHIYKKKNESCIMYMESVDKEPDRIRGGTYDWLHWSEVAFSKIEKGETILTVFDKIVKPTLELRDGYSLLETTLNGKNEFKTLYDNADMYKFATLIVPFWRMVEMGLVRQDTYEQVRSKTHPDIFLQEYECEWVTFQGKVYPELNPLKHIDPAMPGPAPWHRCFFAIDWGYSPSATCVLFAYVTTTQVTDDWGLIEQKKTLHIFDEHYETEELAKITALAIDQKKVAWNITTLAGVADHEEDRIAELTARGIPCGKAEKVDVLGARVQIKEKLYFDSIKIHPRCKHLIMDLEAAVWDGKKDGQIDDSQCTWGHFDAEAALRYLVRAVGDYTQETPKVSPVSYDDMSDRAYAMGRKYQDD